MRDKTKRTEDVYFYSDAIDKETGHENTLRVKKDKFLFASLM
jgi:hypothetical protein